MNMKLGVLTADMLDKRIGQKMSDVPGRHPTEYTEDLSRMAESLSELSDELQTIADYVESKIEEAHLRRGMNLHGHVLSDKQITEKTLSFSTHINDLGHSWVATVSCECGAGEFCETCGPDVLPSIKLAVSKFLES